MLLDLGRDRHALAGEDRDQPVGGPGALGDIVDPRGDLVVLLFELLMQATKFGTGDIPVVVAGRGVEHVFIREDEIEHLADFEAGFVV